jgi:hypothetical protein
MSIWAGPESIVINRDTFRDVIPIVPEVDRILCPQYMPTSKGRWDTSSGKCVWVSENPLVITAKKPKQTNNKKVFTIAGLGLLAFMLFK